MKAIIAIALLLLSGCGGAMTQQVMEQCSSDWDCAGDLVCAVQPNSNDHWCVPPAKIFMEEK